MKPCISQATTLGTPFESDLSAYARAGWTAVQTSRPTPQRTSTSLVDSPMKKRPNWPPLPSVAS